jgi:radical SAM protein with 4Fe4S-binding SPASM domain
MLSLADVKHIYGHLHMHELVDVIYGGGGEPFLNEDLGHIAEYTHRLDPVIQHTVITNGIAWRPVIVEKLVTNNVNFLVSLNAASRESYVAVSGIDGFDSVCSTIGNVNKLRKSAGASVHLAASIILMRQNLHELPHFVRLAASLGVDSVKALYVRVYPPAYRLRSGRARIDPSDSVFFHQELANRMIKEAQIEAEKVKIRFEPPPLFETFKPIARNCLEPWRSLYIDTNGNVFPCAASEIHFKHKVEQQIYRTGNILKEPVEQFWNNSFWQALRKTNFQSDSTQQIVPECACCSMGICWHGPDILESHLMDWTHSETSTLQL